MKESGLDDEAPASDAGIEPQVLADFVALLRQQNMSAVARFVALSPQVRGALGERSYVLFSEHIDNLEFGDAADALAPLLPPSAAVRSSVGARHPEA